MMWPNPLKNIHPRVPVQTILNGVNTTHFVRNQSLGDALRKEYNIDPGAVLIGTIAVFRFQKRLKEWIDVFKSLEQKFPGIKGCIVGDGILNNEIRTYLKQQQEMEDKILLPVYKQMFCPGYRQWIYL